MNKKTIKKGAIPYVLMFSFMLVLLFLLNMGNKTVNDLSYDEFVNNINDGRVSEIEIKPITNSDVYQISGKLKDYEENETFELKAPISEEVIEVILSNSTTKEYTVETVENSASSFWLQMAFNVGLLLILGFVAFFFISKQLGTANKSMDFGKSKAKLNPDENKIRFEHVAGLDEEKEEVQEIIDFLKKPAKFTKMGARIPKGVLLQGAPGTGKTLLARAVAGEADVPFYFISGSDFVELFVGVGASRVRDMFKQAKHNAPCLIFIDEIDAVGRQRGAGVGGGHDEREQTLNQLLTEMDGFGANEGIIIMAATNRPDVLDPALLRPGRFDRQITVSLPDKKGREEILEVHSKNKKFAKNVELKNIAKRTVGFSGAELENLLNEAALLAVRRNKETISMSEVDEAHDRVLMGPAKISHKYTEHEKGVVAYHEAGHAVMGLKLSGANEVQKITIIPRGQAGGYNLMLPKEETYLSTKTELLQTISGLLGGRVAEKQKYGEITTGAHNDFEKATKIARAMVTEYGMSDLGPVQFEHQEASVFLGRDYNKSRNFSGQVAFEIDEQVRKIIDECYIISEKIMKENVELLDLIANTLLDKETITREEIEYLVEHKCLPSDELEDMNVSELKEKAKKEGLKGYSTMNKEELQEKLNEKELEK